MINNAIDLYFTIFIYEARTTHVSALSNLCHDSQQKTQQRRTMSEAYNKFQVGFHYRLHLLQLSISQQQQQQKKKKKKEESWSIENKI